MPERHESAPQLPLIAILVVDDDEVTRNLLCEVLGRITTPAAFEIVTAASGEEAIQRISARTFPIILSDVRMLELDGMAVLKAARKKSEATAVILMTGFGSMEGAIAAIRDGAFDYVSKPFRIEQIEAVIQRAARHWESLATQAMRRASKHLSGARERPEIGPRELVGKSPKIVEVYKTVARAALSSSPVLLLGESGTGKSIVARAIHENSRRREAKFVAWSGTASSPASELPVRMAEAQGGTLYIEEISTISIPAQLELLRVMEEERATVRVIAATSGDLQKKVAAGELREDLLYQLRVIAIELPPLRERMEDLNELVEAFLVRYSRKNNKDISHVSEDALALFRCHSWPGNIRELEHAIERAVVMASSTVLFREDFPGIREREFPAKAGATGTAATGAASEIAGGSLEEIERHHILRVLRDAGFNKSRTAEILGIDRVTLYRKAQRYGIDLRAK